MPYWNNLDYKHLLTPVIFTTPTKNIIGAISLLEEYNIGKYTTINCLRRNTKELKCLIEYMLSNNIDLLVEDNKNMGMKLNPILNCSKKVLREKYGIVLDGIVLERKWGVYLSDEHSKNFNSPQKMLKKLKTE